jgi:hypothetical protein
MNEFLCLCGGCSSLINPRIPLRFIRATPQFMNEFLCASVVNALL